MRLKYIKDRKIYEMINIREKLIIAILNLSSNIHLIKAEEYSRLGSLFHLLDRQFCVNVRDRILISNSFKMDTIIDNNDLIYKMIIYIYIYIYI